MPDHKKANAIEKGVEHVCAMHLEIQQIGLALQPALKARFGFVSIGRYVFEARDMVEWLEISGHHERPRFAHIGWRRVGIIPGKQ
ncbi:hypothetical protein [Aliiroseovarius crassostreae]|uniref:Uncharacterized protein n=1 Tax=Aliiroseovarius crassostreae TaxID=154981 RepID=A0A9Q9HD49_9RHOB|nr:hypothetical protein [Aliiroseovarius crassostreae]UWP97056.1 hypothetical protein K3X48_15595 [Aliiroseovarius crassostreae]UWQ00242.1 hypothetical protein K3X53_15750 [Aliiroseovarius crassostreae]